MRHQCAWCGRDYGSPHDPSEHDFITHGICPDCENHLQHSRPGSLREFLNRYDTPILCVDGDVQVLTANDAACALLSKSVDEIGDAMGGQVMECCWARLPDGCGRTEHCVACTIRRLVTGTLDGLGNTRDWLAYVERLDDGGQVRRVDLRVSSERHGESVLLRIDGVDDTTHKE
jgi:hypothetical protein